MNNWEERRKMSRVLYSKGALILLIILLVLAVKGTWNLYYKSLEAGKNKEQVEKQLAELDNRHQFLKQGLKELNSQSGVEALLRQKFNVKKEGEEVAIIVLDKEEEELDGGGIGSFLSKFFVGLVDIFR